MDYDGLPFTIYNLHTIDGQIHRKAPGGTAEKKAKLKKMAGQNVLEAAMEEQHDPNACAATPGRRDLWFAGYPIEVQP